MLVTGFGPFLKNAENPSARLAGASGQRFAVLDVSYRTVDAFLEAEGGEEPWLMLGLADKAQEFLIETVGRNWVGPVPDNEGAVCGPGAIDPSAPPAISARLWTCEVLSMEGARASVDAGGYLCNYMLFRALALNPGRRIGFMHVPPFAVCPFERQVEFLRKVIEATA